MRPSLQVALVCFSVMLLFPLVVFADPAVAKAGLIPAGLGFWPSMALLGCVAGSYALRKWAPAGNFLHAPGGAFALAAATGILNAVAVVIQTRGLNAQAIGQAAVSVVFSLLATSNPSTPPGAVPLMSPKAFKGPIASIVALVMIPLALAGCLPPLAACKLPSAPDVAKCKLEQDLISCGEKSGFDLLPVLLDVVLAEIGHTFDAGTLVAQLEGLGIKDVPCILAAAENYLLPVAPQLAGKVHLALVAKLKKDGRHGMVTITLSAGRSISTVLP